MVLSVYMRSDSSTSRQSSDSIARHLRDLRFVDQMLELHFGDAPELL